MFGALPVRTAVVATLLSGGSAAARADCLPYPLEQVMPRAAVVSSPAARTHFVRGAETAGCPSDADACRERAYVVPRDAVLVTEHRGGYACALLTNPKGTTTEDWLPASALTMVPEAASAPGDWIGRWRTGDQYIAIRAAAPGLLAVKGDATWGSHDPERVRNGAVHTGEVEGTAAPEAGLLAFVQGDDDRTLPYADADACRIRMRLVGPFLWAWEHACGGLNVTFTGAYARMSR